MTTLDDVERTLDPSVLLIADEDGPTSIAGLMGGERSEVRETHHARADGGRQLERPEPPAHLDEARAAHGGLRPLREGPRARAGDGRPDRRDEADARADRRAAGRRHDRRRRRGSAAGDDPPARREGRAAARHRRPARGVRPDPARARVRRRGRRRRARRHRARLPPQRRHARGRPRRGGRAPVGAREAPGHAALAPRRQRPPRRPPRRCAAASRTRSSAPGSPRPSAGASPRPTCPAGCGSAARTCAGARCGCATRCPRSSRRCARRCSARCWTACAATARAGWATCGCSRSARSTSTRRAPDEPRATQPLPDERTQLGALLTGALRPAVVARAGAAARRLLRRQGRAGGGARARSAPTWSVEPAREPFLHPGRAARVLVGGEPAGWLGELHPSVAAGWDVEQAAGFELELAVLARHAALDPHYRDLTSFPSVRQDRAWWFPRHGRRGRRDRGRARRGRRAAGRRRGVRRLRRPASARRWRSGMEFRARRPDAHRRGGRAAAREDRRRRGRAPRGRAAWLASRSSARRATRARSRPRCCTATRSSSCAHVTARSDAGARLDEVHPRTRVPLVLEEPTTELDVDAAVVAYPHGAAAPVVAELLERGIRVVDLSRRLPPARPRHLRASGTASTRRPQLLGEAVYGLPERYREQIRDARLVANPGCYPTAAILALAPLRGPAGRRGHRREVGRLRRRPRADATASTSSPSTRP